MVVLPRAQRANLQVMSDGKRMNWTSISYFWLEELTEEEGYSISFKWKYKASLKVMITKWTGKELNLQKHFRGFNVVELKDNFYINLNRVQMVEEEAIHGPVEKTKITIYFEDGLYLTQIFEATKWAWWKTTFL
jgi:hypothetical protein